MDSSRAIAHRLKPQWPRREQWATLGAIYPMAGSRAAAHRIKPQWAARERLLIGLNRNGRVESSGQPWAPYIQWAAREQLLIGLNRNGHAYEHFSRKFTFPKPILFDPIALQ